MSELTDKVPCKTGLPATEVTNQLEIHETLQKKLAYFIEIKEIPNILLYGPPGGGKRILIKNFIRQIYADKKENENNLVMYVECGHGKGIKFIRDEVNYFAKINCTNADFKTIVLLNADNLTIDAQSALRRSIEIFSKKTRYFIIVHDKNRLLNPLLSRFCELFVPLARIENKEINLHNYNKDNAIMEHNSKITRSIKTKLAKYAASEMTYIKCMEAAKELYNKGICGVHFLEYMKCNNYDETVLLIITKLIEEIKSEELLLLCILVKIFIRFKENNNNILSM